MDGQDTSLDYLSCYRRNSHSTAVLLDSGTSLASIPFHGSFLPLKLEVTEPSSFEILTIQLKASTLTLIVSICRPPGPLQFNSELTAILSDLCTMCPNFILMGDYTIHCDKRTGNFTKDFSSDLDSFGLIQYINFPTHNKGHVLDLVCCSGVTPCHFNFTELPISDHKMVFFDVMLLISNFNL